MHFCSYTVTVLSTRGGDNTLQAPEQPPHCPCPPCCHLRPAHTAGRQRQQLRRGPERRKQWPEQVTDPCSLPCQLCTTRGPCKVCQCCVSTESTSRDDQPCSQTHRHTCSFLYSVLWCTSRTCCTAVVVVALFEKDSLHPSTGHLKRARAALESTSLSCSAV